MEQFRSPKIDMYPCNIARSLWWRSWHTWRVFPYDDASPYYYPLWHGDSTTWVGTIYKILGFLEQACRVTWYYLLVATTSYLGLGSIYWVWNMNTSEFFQFFVTLFIDDRVLLIFIFCPPMMISFIFNFALEAGKTDFLKFCRWHFCPKTIFSVTFLLGSFSC
jgi:hypothetical protein